MSEIIEAFKRYRDEHGLTGLYTLNDHGLPTQNGALFTLDYALILLEKETDAHEFTLEISRLWNVYSTLESDVSIGGLTLTRPGSNEFDSMDNVGAILVFSSLFDAGRMARRIYEHGNSVECTGIETIQDKDRNFKYYPHAALLNGLKPPKFYYNNNRPELFCERGWYGKSPGFRALIKICVNDPKIKPTWFENVGLWVGQFLGLFSPLGKTEGKKLPYNNWQVLKNRNWFWRLSYKVWCLGLMLSYQHGMKTVNSIYYRDPAHPAIEFSPNYSK